jgi:hypothetical protein
MRVNPENRREGGPSCAEISCRETVLMVTPRKITVQNMPVLNADSSSFRVYGDGRYVGTVRISDSQMTREHLMDDIVRWCELNFAKLSTSEETSVYLDEVRRQ